MLHTTRRSTALLAAGVLALGGLTAAGCGDDVVDDNVEEDLEDGVDDIGDTFEDGVDEIDEQIEEMDDGG